MVLATFVASTLIFTALSTNQAFGAVDITLSAESAGGHVDQSPNLPGGGFESSQSKPRFKALSLGIDWDLSARTSVSFSLAQRDMNSLRDSYEINQVALSTVTRISPAGAPYLLGVNVRLAVNHADQLLKNSFTSYNGATIRSASINRPQDRTLSAALTGVRPLGRGFSFLGRLSAGLVSSDHDSMQGQGQSSEGCQYAFSTNGSTGSLRQQGGCGVLISYSQEFANEDGVEERLGFRSSQDVAYKARFVGAGGELGWSHRSVSVSVGYRFREYFRDNLDHRITVNGDTPTRISQVARAIIAYSPRRRWTVSLASIYQTAPFLDDIPMLYTAFTSKRYTGGDSLSFQLSVTLRL